MVQHLRRHFLRTRVVDERAAVPEPNMVWYGMVLYGMVWYGMVW